MYIFVVSVVTSFVGYILIILLSLQSLEQEFIVEIRKAVKTIVIEYLHLIVFAKVIFLVVVKPKLYNYLTINLIWFWMFLWFWWLSIWVWCLQCVTVVHTCETVGEFVILKHRDGSGHEAGSGSVPCLDMQWRAAAWLLLVESAGTLQGVCMWGRRSQLDWSSSICPEDPWDAPQASRKRGPGWARARLQLLPVWFNQPWGVYLLTGLGSV